MPQDEATPQAVNPAVTAPEPLEATWRKARLSGAENGGCVEIAGGLPGFTGIRDSCRPHDGAHFVTTAAFAAFLAATKAGAYDMGPR